MKHKYKEMWDLLYGICEDYEIELNKIQDWHFRIGSRLDIFPKSNKYHNIYSGERGVFERGKIEAFILKSLSE